MDFFNDLSKKITKGSMDAVQKTRNMADTVKYNASITEEEKKIAQYERELGKMFYEMYPNLDEERLKVVVEAIQRSKEAIQHCENSIQSLKGVVYCPNCGAEYPDTTLFCSQCGTKIVQDGH
jgi:Zn finger protein HypA/HybF involved in hydrogenase expression